MKNKTKKIVISALLSSLVCVATIIIKIPSPTKGYINAGDSIVLLAGWILPHPYGFLSAGIGSMLADIISGYIIYTPATFIIKGIMAFSIRYLSYSFCKIRLKKISVLLSVTISEIIMLIGYFLYETILYGIVLATMNIPANLIQAIAGIVLGYLLLNYFIKTNLKENSKI